MTVTSATARMASAIVLMLALVPVGTCQTTAAEDSAAESSEPLEEIIVYGERNLIHLRQEVYAAEENFFAVNDDFRQSVVRRHHSTMRRVCTAPGRMRTLPRSLANLFSNHSGWIALQLAAHDCASCNVVTGGWE